MKSISIRNEAECCIIDIEGTIGIPEEWQFEHPDERVATYEGFREAVQRIADLPNREIVVNIRSTGGDVNDALLIYEALVATGAHITTRCYGYTASAATIIAQAASEGCRELASGALYLIHNSICAAEGNAEELEAQTELLRKTDARLADIYAARSGRSAEEFRTLMAENSGRGRWLSPEEALETGLVDLVVEHHKAPVAPAEEGEEGKMLTTEEPATAPDKGPGKLSDEGLTQNLARGWQRLLAALRSREPQAEQPPLPEMHEEHNFLHKPLFEEPVVRSKVLFSEGQKQAKATTLKSVEDPSLRDVNLTPNEQAYAADLKRLCGYL